MEQFEASPELAKQLIDAGIAGKVEKPIAEPAPVGEPKAADEPLEETTDGPVQTETPQAPEVTPKNGKKKGR